MEWLVQECDSEQNRHSRVDVRNDRCACDSRLPDQKEIEKESDRSARYAEHDEGNQHQERRRCRHGQDDAWQENDGCNAETCRDRSELVNARKVALNDQRRCGIRNSGDRDAGDAGPCVRAIDCVKPEKKHDAGESDYESHEASRSESLADPEEWRQKDDHQRNACDHRRGQR